MEKRNKIAPNKDENLPVYKENYEEEKELLIAKKDAILQCSKDFSEIAKTVATELIKAGQEQQKFSNELKKAQQTSDNSIRNIKVNYSIKKDAINENLETLRFLRKTMERFDVVNLSESQERTYNLLLERITLLVNKTTELYNGLL